MLIYVSAYPLFLLIVQVMSDILIVTERALEHKKNLLDRKRAKGLSMQEAVEVQTHDTH